MVDRISATALRLWQHEGVTVAITANFLGSRNGYLRLPDGWSGDVGDLGAPREITYGPDAFGWVGFDLIHAWDVWTPDDPSEMVVDEALLLAQRMMAELTVPDPVVWTSELLAGCLEAMAARVAARV